MSRRPFLPAVILLLAGCTGDADTTTTRTVTATSVVEEQAPFTYLADLPGRLVVLDETGNIVTVDPDGSDPAAVTDDAGETASYLQPSFSPVDDRLVWSEISAAGAGLGSSDGRGGGRVSVPMPAPPFFMSWSPDGGSVGVLHNSPQGSIDFEMVDLGATSTQVLASGSPFYFSWSPDSSQVAAHIQSEVFAAITLDGATTDLGATAVGYQAPHWTPGGIIHLGPDGLEIRQVDGTARLLAAAPGPVAFVANRQGNRVAVQSFVDDQPPGVSAALTQTQSIPANTVVVIEIDSGAMSEVVAANSIGLFWSPDGEALLVLTPGETEGVLETVVWRDGQVSRLSVFSPHPALVEQVLRFFDQYGQSLQLWSPDSAAFALVGAIGDDPGVWIHPLAGGEPVKVSDGSWVSWSGT